MTSIALFIASSLRVGGLPGVHVSVLPGVHVFVTLSLLSFNLGVALGPVGPKLYLSGSPLYL